MLPNKPAFAFRSRGEQAPQHSGLPVRSLSDAQVSGAGEEAERFVVFRDGFVIETIDQLIDSRLEFKLTSDGDDGEKTFDVAPFLRGKIVPVVRAGVRKVCWIFCLQRFTTTEIDTTRDVANQLRSRGYSLDRDFQLVVVADVFLQQIAEGKIKPNVLRMKREASSNPETSSLLRLFDDIINWGYKQGAADVDFIVHRRSEFSQVALNIDGKWVRPPRFRINTDMLLRCLSLAFQLGEGSVNQGLEVTQEQQLRIHRQMYDGSHVMLRWASMAADNVYVVTTRIVRMSEGTVLSLDQLGYLDDHMAFIRRGIRSDGGAVIFSGVVNSGKSTSLAAMVACIPNTRKVITIEDPAEIFLPNAISNTVTRPLDGSNSPQLAAKLATLKRTGFNDFLLGEIRDSATGKAAQDVFESGQKIYTTVHGAAAWKIPDRLAGPAIGIPREALSSPGNLRLLVYQALLPTNCSHCARPLSDLTQFGDSVDREEAAELIKRLERLYRADLSKVTVRNHEGCPHCRREGMSELNGLKGRTTVAEMLEPDDEFCAIVSKADGVAMLQYLQRLRGDVPFDDPRMVGKSAMECAVYKMLQGGIDPREIEPRFSTFEQVELERRRRGL